MNVSGKVKLCPPECADPVKWYKFDGCVWVLLDNKHFLVLFSDGKDIGSTENYLLEYKNKYCNTKHISYEVTYSGVLVIHQPTVENPFFGLTAYPDVVTYQWQKLVNGNWINIIGEDLPTLQVMEPGNKYRCKATHQKTIIISDVIEVELLGSAIYRLMFHNSQTNYFSFGDNWVASVTGARAFDDDKAFGLNGPTFGLLEGFFLKYTQLPAGKYIASINYEYLVDDRNVHESATIQIKTDKGSFIKELDQSTDPEHTVGVAVETNGGAIEVYVNPGRYGRSSIIIGGGDSVTLLVKIISFQLSTV